MVNRKLQSKYKASHSLDYRKAEADKVRERHPDRLPVICEKVEGSAITDLDKNKFLVPADLTVGQFVLVVRKRVMLDPAVAGVLTQLEAQYTVIEHEPRHSAIARASLHALPAGHNLPAIDHETPAAPMRDAAPDDVPVIDVTEN